MKYDNCKNCIRECEHAGKDREFVCKNGISCKKTGKSNTLIKMAEYIMNSRAEHCSECCVNFKACNARFAEDENAPLPADEFCIKNIIKFFENEVNNESHRD